MSKRTKSPRLDLRLNLSPPKTPTSSSISTNLSLDFSISSSSSSPSPSSVSTHSSEGSSCLSSEAEETRTMLLVGCPRCLMYVMLYDVDPKCPKCKSTVLLDFLNNEEKNKKTSI
ncbi:hypothetical protein Lal_00028782 [Lupinus albus]|uniref:GIR1-like zinc ribbon domain-containing protein n=1 Tax=Lupinus albus TaxID=3870 RepID=A0A6A4NVL4_LUPAL|nr:hypothetical protein Lalb_Chr19g0136321 [Lupinus albus]KAF1884894.1 hypothetical protein Lal_00028782 [Lupinus albus]